MFVWCLIEIAPYCYISEVVIFLQSAHICVHAKREGGEKVLVGGYLLKLDGDQACLELEDRLAEDVDGRDGEHGDEDVPRGLHFSKCQ